jgi:hypothetical protein
MRRGGRARGQTHTACRDGVAKHLAAIPPRAVRSVRPAISAYREHKSDISVAPFSAGGGKLPGKALIRRTA